MLSEVKANYGRLRNLINGEWVEADTREWLDVENPATTEIIAQVPISSPADVRDAVAAAKQAFLTWRETPPVLRARHLFTLKGLMEDLPFGNAASIFTSNGGVAREFKHRVTAGNVGVNVGVAAPMAFFPFGGMKDSFFGSHHPQSREVVDFFTDRKIVISRWF